MRACKSASSLGDLSNKELSRHMSMTWIPCTQGGRIIAVGVTGLCTNAVVFFFIHSSYMLPSLVKPIALLARSWKRSPHVNNFWMMGNPITTFLLIHRKENIGLLIALIF